MASERGAVVHMPRIGSGLAGGNWEQIEVLVQKMAAKHRVDVVVHDKPGSAPGRWR